MIFVWALAVLFAVYSLVTTVRSNFTAGTLLLWGITIFLFVFCIFHKAILQFASHGVGRILKWSFFAGCAFFAGMLVFVAVSGYSNTAKGDEKAIVILGAGLHGETVSNVLERRLIAGHEAWLANPGALIVVTGGQGNREVIPEAVAMQRWLVNKGVPEDCILLEDKSTSTEENLEFAKQLLQQAGIDETQPVAVVSNAFHCYRAGKYAGYVGFTEVRLVPASMNVFSIPPSYMREVLAILYLWVFKH